MSETSDRVTAMLPQFSMVSSALDFANSEEAHLAARCKAKLDAMDNEFRAENPVENMNDLFFIQKN